MHPDLLSLDNFYFLGCARELEFLSLPVIFNLTSVTKTRVANMFPQMVVVKSNGIACIICILIAGTVSTNKELHDLAHKTKFLENYA